MNEKWITFYMSDDDGFNSSMGAFIIRPKGMKHGYVETIKAINNGEKHILTTQIILLNTSLFMMGYRIFVKDINDEHFEIKLGQNERTNREIKMGHNLHKMLLAGEFNKKGNLL